MWKTKRAILHSKGSFNCRQVFSLQDASLSVSTGKSTAVAMRVCAVAEREKTLRLTGDVLRENAYIQNNNIKTSLVEVLSQLSY